MVLEALVKVIWLTREISGMNLNDHFQWFVVGKTETFEMVKKKKKARMKWLGMAAL